MEVLKNTHKNTEIKLWKIQFSDDFFPLSHIGKKLVFGVDSDAKL